MKLRGWIFSLSLLLPLGLSFAPPAHAQLFGESDEEKAARQAHEDAQDAKIAQEDGRIKALEDQVQSLTQSLSQATGANEELGHQLQQLSDRLDREEKDFSYRLCTLSAQQLGADDGDQGLNCASAGTASPGRVSSNNAGGNNGGLAPGAVLPPLGSDNSTIDASGAPRPLARPPGTLGTLPAGPGSAPVPAGNTRPFDTAMNLLASQQYAQASAAFRSYADANPDDQNLSPQAIYWIGDIAFVQQDYPTAISSFAEEIKKYPNSSRSPDSMLKLGQSLLATGNNSGGCTTLAALKTKYPQASVSTLAAAANARKASCGK